MKKILLSMMLLTSVAGFAQQPTPLIYAVTPGTNDLYQTDTTLWTTPASIPAVITSSLVDGMTSIAYDPTTYKSYIVAKIGFDRYLAGINLATGASTVMGLLGDNFSSITFDETGQLWGATGDGASVPEGLFMINKATASNTLAFMMGNGADGEVVCFNRFDNKMYHWSGNGTVVYESWPITNLTYAPTNISTSGSVSNETFGALNLTATKFIVGTISPEYQHLSSTGFYSPASVANPDGFRGMIMPPRFAMSPTVACANSGSVNLYSNCLQLYDSVYYYWGDGSVSQVTGTSAVQAPSSHVYSTPGTYTISVMLYNGVVPKSIFTTYTIGVATSPSVTISGSGTLCTGSTITLTASGGGASQWYSSGVAIPNATTSSYVVSAPGWYNMTKTNLNSCSDSAAVGHLVVAGTSPTITVLSGTICSGLNFGLNPQGAATYTVSGGNTIVSPTVTTTYSVTGTGTSGCESASAAVATVVVGYPPTLTVTSSNATICVGQSATLTAVGAASFQWAGGPITNSIVVAPTTTSVYIVTGQGSVACSSTVNITQYVSECTGLSENTPKSSAWLMPNPTNGKILIQNIGLLSLVEIYSAFGQRILTTVSESDSLELDLGNFSSGVYFMRVNEKDKLPAQIKVIKE